MKTTYQLLEPEGTSLLADDMSDSEGLAFHDMIRDQPEKPFSHASEREKVLALLIRRIAELPRATKKILALYYHENFPLSEIAAGFNLTEAQIREILSQTVGSFHPTLP